MEDEDKNVVGSSIQLVTEVLKAAGNSPELRETGKNLASSALIISQTVKHCLVPLAAVNFAIEKARTYFNEQFQKDMEEHTKKIRPENVVEPKASVAGPALQGLAFTHEEPELKAMFLSLLATSMDRRTALNAHPAFVEIIKQLTAEEANLLRYFLKDVVPVVELRMTTKNYGNRTLNRHIVDFQDQNTGEAIVYEPLSSMIDNWIRLGLVEVNFQKTLVDPRAYQWVKDRPEYKQRVMEISPGTDEKITLARGSIFPTDLGRKFALAVDIAH